MTIAGAGPAGLAAAIVLARRGHAVTVFERSACVGSRFHDDLQDIENGSTDADALTPLPRLAARCLPAPAADGSHSLERVA